METNLSRALIISDGSLAFLWERPLTALIMSLALLALMLPIPGRLLGFGRLNTEAMAVADKGEG